MTPFEEFWLQYPREGQSLGSKSAARKKYEKLSPDLHPVILSAIIRQKAWRERAAKAGQFVPIMKHPVTWINQECWEDEIPEVKDQFKDVLDRMQDRSWAEPTNALSPEENRAKMAELRKKIHS